MDIYENTVIINGDMEEYSEILLLADNESEGNQFDFRRIVPLDKLDQLEDGYIKNTFSRAHSHNLNSFDVEISVNSTFNDTKNAISFNTHFVDAYFVVMHLSALYPSVVFQLLSKKTTTMTHCDCFAFFKGSAISSTIILNEEACGFLLES